MSDAAITVETATTRDGTAQLRRRWAVENPKAAMQIVHGIGEHSGRYLHVGEYFAGRGFDVAAYDNRGFGESGGRRGHIDRFELYLDDIEAALAARAELGVPTVLYGHSLGGLMVTRYLVGDRPQPDCAVLSSPALSAEAPRWQKVAAPVIGRIAPKLFFPAEPYREGLSRDPVVQEAYVNDPLLVAGATARLGQQTFKSMKATNKQLDRIRVPTFVFHGDADPIVLPSASEPLAELGPVTYRRWPGLRHECHNEPEQVEVLAAVAAWVEATLSDS